MDRTLEIDEELDALARYLKDNRRPLLQSWSTAVASDPELTTASSLPRTQFLDHIPDILDAFERRLRALPAAESARSQEERKEDAGAHGLQRWQQGYQLREVMREWGHLHIVLAAALERYAASNAQLDPATMPIARRALIDVINDGVAESTSQYFHLRQIEAAGHAREVEQTLEQLRELERQRAELWRQAAHDLRGNVGVVINATTGLSSDEVPAAVRERFLRLLQRSVSSLQSTLEDVMNLARLQAGHEKLDTRPFDAAAMLAELGETLQPLARQQGLYLEMQGPKTLHVEGDAVKLRRIAQNLLLNALKYTRKGGVTLSWGDSREGDEARWMLCVSDTGPGLHTGSAAPLAGALKAATQEARQIEERAMGDVGGDDAVSGASGSTNGTTHSQRGEGIGLSIVKRLCDLLDASIELDSSRNGTTFRVAFPRRYRARSEL